MSANKLTPLALAKIFHNLYEDLAPRHGYVTRVGSQVFNPESPNGKTMIATCEALMKEGSGVGICDLQKGEKVMDPNVIVELIIKFTRGSTIDMDITKNRILPDERLDDVCLSMATHARDYFKLKMGDKTPKIQLLNDPRKLN